MAEASVQDVVNEAQSMGDSSSVDVSGNQLSASFSEEGEEQQVSLLQQKKKERPSEQDAAADLNSSSSTFPFQDASSKVIQHQDKETLLDFDSNSLVADPNLVNGLDTASFTGSDDAGYQNLLATDGSVHSDPEPSQDPATRVDRSSSVKKPTPFKSVSVTKNFLAKSGSTPTTMSKTGPDRAQGGSPLSTSASQAPKPRLVAKSGKDARSLNLGGGTSSGAGPDASTVWNRNRPVPPPPPKQFTDEELKQQYGIHMATRLQADEAGKESKWADIDDDEDDWAPDTVQWMDGTKSTLLPTEHQAPPPKPELAQEPVTSVEHAGNDLSQQQSQTQGSISSVGKTILRPGARVTSQTRPGLVLKNAPEKPAQIEKPTPQNTGRSPWAPLPPVDKSSPITFYPPSTTSRPPPPVRRDSLAQEDQAVAVTSPAREIAADDFDRSWRDAGDRSGRELFNSQSGRYEPVKSVRRGSRHDGGFRPPAVLQRPSHQGYGGASNEMTSTSQNRDSHSWTARRDSSSFGFSNAPHERRPSIEPSGHVQAHELAKNEQDTVSGSEASQQPANQGQVSDSQPPSANAYSAHGPDANNKQVASANDQEARVLQSHLMRERIELNRKRKEMELAQEEAAKQERIRQKLEALQSSQSPQLSKASEASPSSQTASVQETHNQTHPPLPEVEKDSKAERPSVEALSTSATVDLTSQSQRPPSKSPNIEHSAKKSLSDSNLSSAITPEVQQLPGLGQPIPQDRQMPSWGRLPRGLDHPNNWNNKTAASGSANVWGPPASDRSLGNGAFEHEVNRGPPMQLANNSNSMPQAQAQLMAAPLSPSMQFDGAHPTPSPPPHAQPHQETFSHHHHHHPHHPPPPPASPNSQSRHFMHQPLQPGGRQGHPNSGSEWQRPKDLSAAKNAWANFPSQLQVEEAELRERTNREWENKKQEEERSGIKQDLHPTFRETFRQTVPGDVLGQRRVVAVTKTVHEGGSQAGGDQRAMNGSGQPSFAQRPAAQTTSMYSTNNARGSRFFGPSAERVHAMPVHHPIAATAGDVAAVDEVAMFSGPPSPPPPDDSADHPVHAGQTGHPLVKIRLKPTVKLPDTAKDEDVRKTEMDAISREALPLPAPIQPPQQTRAAMSSTKPLLPGSGSVIMPPLSREPSGQQPPTLIQQDWQHKFHALFHSVAAASSTPSATAAVSGNPTPFKTPQSGLAAAPIMSSTKSLFEPSVPVAARVSLPHGSEHSGGKGAEAAEIVGSSVESKPTEEELVDEREFGSSPTVHLLKGIHPREQAIMLPCPPIHLSVGTKTPITLVEMQNPEFIRTLVMLTFEYLDEELFVSSGTRIKVQLLGKPPMERILAKKEGAHSQAQARRASARSTPRKSFGGARGAGSKWSSPRTDLQTGKRTTSSTPIRKSRMDENKTSSTPPLTPKLVDTSPQVPSPGNATGSSESMSERNRTKRHYAKPARSVRGKRSAVAKT